MSLIVNANYLRKVADGFDLSAPTTLKLHDALIDLADGFDAHVAVVGQEADTLDDYLAVASGVSAVQAALDALGIADVSGLQAALDAKASTATTSSHDVRLDTAESDITALQSADTALQSAIDAVDAALTTEVSDRTSGDAGLQASIDAITTILASDDAALDTAQERVDKIKQLIADVDTLAVADVSGLQEALDAIATDYTLTGFAFTESATNAEALASLEAQSARPGSVGVRVTPRGIRQRWIRTTTGVEALHPREPKYIGNDLPSASEFAPGSAFEHLDGATLLTTRYEVNAEGALVVASVYPTPDIAPQTALRADDVSRLSSLSVSDGDVVSLQGFHAAGDGGDQLLTYRSAGKAGSAAPLVFDGGGPDDFFVPHQTQVLKASKFGVRAHFSGITAEENNAMMAANYTALSAMAASGQPCEIDIDGDVRWSGGTITFTGNELFGRYGSSSIRRIDTADEPAVRFVDHTKLSIRRLTISKPEETGEAPAVHFLRCNTIVLDTFEAHGDLPVAFEGTYWVMGRDVSFIKSASDDSPAVLFDSKLGQLRCYLIRINGLRVWRGPVVFRDTNTSTTLIREIRLDNVDFEVVSSPPFVFDTGSAIVSDVVIDQMSIYDSPDYENGPIFDVRSGVKSVTLANTLLQSEAGIVAPSSTGRIQTLTLLDIRGFYSTAQVGDAADDIIHVGATRDNGISRSALGANKFQNLCSHDLSSIADEAGIEAPDGSSTAFRMTNTSGSTVYRKMKSGALPASVGEFIVAGVWTRELDDGLAPAGVNVRLLNGQFQTQGAIFNYLQLQSSELTPVDAAGRWRWVCGIGKIASMTHSTLSADFQVQMSNNRSLLVAWPVFLHLRFEASYDEARRVMNQLRCLPPGVPAGGVGTLDHQPFRAGDGTFAGGHLMLGDAHVWVEAGQLRFSPTPPASATDGTVISS